MVAALDLARKHSNVDASRCPHQAAHGASEHSRSQILLYAVSDKNLSDVVRARVSHDGLDGIFTFEHRHLRAVLSRLRQSLLHQSSVSVGEIRPPYVRGQHVAVETRRVSSRCGHHALEVCSRSKTDQEALVCTPMLFEPMRMHVALQSGVNHIGGKN